MYHLQVLRTNDCPPMFTEGILPPPDECKLSQLPQIQKSDGGWILAFLSAANGGMSLHGI